MTSRTEGPVTLVVGADSVIGGALLESLQSSGQPAIGTTRRKESVNESRPFLDLSKESVNWTDPHPVETAVLCASVTSLEACRTDPSGSRQINVEAACALAEYFSAQGAFVIFLSTSLVFDGAKPFPSTGESVSPATEYGRQKAEAERRISQLNGPMAIVRFTKVLGPNNPLFESWTLAMRKGQPIHPFKNLHFAPIPLFTAASVLKLTVDRRLSGIFHVSGERDISYAEAAQVAAGLLKVDSNLVQPIEASESGKVFEQVDCFTALDIDQLKTTLGIQPPPVSRTLEAAFLDPQALARSI